MLDDGSEVPSLRALVGSAHRLLLNRTTEPASSTSRPVPYEWSRFDTKYLRLSEAAVFVPGAIAALVAVLSGHVVVAIVVALLGVIPPLLSWSIIRSLRDGAKHLLVRPSGDIDIIHPMLDTPYRIPSENVHSIWSGPFDQPPLTRRDRWMLRGKRFPSPVVNISEVAGPAQESVHDVLIVFRRSITPQFRTNFSSNAWLLGGPHSPFSARKVNGLVVSFATEPESAALRPHTIRDVQTMPSDVRSWLS